MTDIEKLKNEIEESGITITALTKKAGMKRETLYNRMKGIGEFTASEIVALAEALHMSDELRDEIFLSKKLHRTQLEKVTA